MKRGFKMAVLGVFLSVSPVLWAGSEGWLTDFETAKTASKARGVPILVNFSGSDWCGWCIRLDKEVFSQEAFVAFAKDAVVLFEADFPQQKEQPAKIKQQNHILQHRYQVRGFPTVLLLDAQGHVLARTGYQRGGAEKYVAHLQELMGKAAE